MVTDREPRPRPRPGQPPELLEPEEPLGGESACYARLVCPECGAVTTEGHRPGCAADPKPGPQES